MSERASTVAIVGCGLIGGSIGIALRRRRPAWTIVGLDQADRIPGIEAAAFTDRVGTLDDVPALLPLCGLVFLATPVEVILELLPRIAPHLAPETVVTDVGGTKEQIAARAREVLPDNVCFIGGHPIAGSENAGVAAADPLLFKGRPYVLCPDPNTPAPALLTLLDVLEDLHATPLTLDAAEHDRILAMVSHVPQMLSIALVHAALEEDAFHRLLHVTVGQGFLDITRVAASGYEQWRGVLATNRRPIRDALDRLERSIGVVRRSMDDASLETLWTAVSAKRRRMTPERWSRKRKADIRTLIDRHDRQILKVLGDRMAAVRKMGALKAEQGSSILDPDRERRLLNDRRDLAESYGIPSDLVSEMFEVIMKHTKKAQTS